MYKCRIYIWIYISGSTNPKCIPFDLSGNTYWNCPSIKHYTRSYILQKNWILDASQAQMCVKVMKDISYSEVQTVISSLGYKQDRQTKQPFETLLLVTVYSGSMDCT